MGEAGFIKRLSGYVAGEDLALRKTFGSFPGNPERFGHPTTSSVVLLFDSETSLTVCLMEGSYVAALQTDASTAVTAP